MKKAIIIGATSGIGRELAILLAENNYLVGITGRRKFFLEELESEYKGSFLISSFDITETFNVSKKLDELVRNLGGLDLLILSSGTGDINENLDFKIEKSAIDVNVSGFTEAADWAYNFFAQQKSGHLAAITSIAGIRGSGAAPAYNATKAYQINYLEGLRQKIKKLKLPVFITDIRPGLVDTEMAKSDGLFWVAPLEKASVQIFKAIENKKRIAYVTKRWGLIALFLKLVPGRFYERL